jgi:uncharacterized Ntn-hydrolase superfamily protein
MINILNFRFPLAHTFSIIARDPQTGRLGVAAQSHWFSVGSLVTWAQAGIGAVATQAVVEVSYGPLGLDLMRAGFSAPEALTELLKADSGRSVRQVAMVDVKGRVAVHTGERCIEAAGHYIGEGFSVQANMMTNATVWEAMAEAYQKAKGDLAERLLAALEAGQSAGGDIRGQQSAALLVVADKPSGQPWKDTLINLRVEDHPQPIAELRRLATLHQAYELMNAGDQQLGQGNIDEALERYRTAAQMAPSIVEMPFWHAVTLAELGRLEEALPIFKQVFQKEPAWATLLQRLPRAGLLRNDLQMMRRILSLMETT